MPDVPKACSVLNEKSEKRSPENTQCHMSDTSALEQEAWKATGSTIESAHACLASQCAMLPEPQRESSVTVDCKPSVDVEEPVARRCSAALSENTLARSEASYPNEFSLESSASLSVVPFQLPNQRPQTLLPCLKSDEVAPSDLGCHQSSETEHATHLPKCERLVSHRVQTVESRGLLREERQGLDMVPTCRDTSLARPSKARKSRKTNTSEAFRGSSKSARSRSVEASSRRSRSARRRSASRGDGRLTRRRRLDSSSEEEGSGTSFERRTEDAEATLRERILRLGAPESLRCKSSIHKFASWVLLVVQSNVLDWASVSAAFTQEFLDPHDHADEDINIVPRQAIRKCLMAALDALCFRMAKENVPTWKAFRRVWLYFFKLACDCLAKHADRSELTWHDDLLQCGSIENALGYERTRALSEKWREFLLPLRPHSPENSESWSSASSGDEQDAAPPERNVERRGDCSRDVVVPSVQGRRRISRRVPVLCSKSILDRKLEQVEAAVESRCAYSALSAELGTPAPFSPVVIEHDSSRVRGQDERNESAVYVPGMGYVSRDQSDSVRQEMRS
eukprot:TRINITY_DN28796_c0_g1_i1.p1 TRINITY_DN28796_c0_g1~~TRINITY_DN28796_c0_g1_i1.p1  ORF type:complete len:644 (+),score=89.03 TRINITY_DN28796_c0_g1_i1:230-1933(+)